MRATRPSVPRLSNLVLTLPTPQLVDEAIKTADIIAGQSKMSARMVKEATNAA